MNATQPVTPTPAAAAADVPVLWRDGFGQIFRGRYLEDNLLVMVVDMFGKSVTRYTDSRIRADIIRQTGSLVRVEA